MKLFNYFIRREIIADKPNGLIGYKEKLYRIRSNNLSMDKWTHKVPPNQIVTIIEKFTCSSTRRPTK